MEESGRATPIPSAGGATVSKRLASDPRVWTTAAMVALVVVVHLVLDLAQDRHDFPAPGFVWVLLLLVPTVYAGTQFGLVGSLTTALVGNAAIIPGELLTRHTDSAAWGEWSAVTMVFVVAALLGYGVDRENRLRSRMLEVEREQTVRLLDGQALSWRHLFDALPAGIVLVGADGVIKDVNGHLGALSGYRTDELVGSSIEVLVPPRLRHSHAGHRDGLNGEPAERPHGARPSLRLQRRDGVEVPVDIALTPLAGTGTQIALVLDDTARAEAERARQTAERRFRLAFDKNVAAMAVADPEGRLLDINRSYSTMLGVAADDLIGRDVLALTHPEDREAMAEHHRRLIAGEVAHVEYTKRYIRSDGRVIYARILTGIVRDENDSPSFLVASARDITEERSLAEQLSHQARHDPLTGLPNRRLFEEHLDKAASGHTRRGWCALVLIDLDDFKGVNDTLGHDVGDELLVELARRLTRVAQRGDMLARPGDDEFLYLAEGLESRDEADMVVDRLLGALREPLVLGAGRVEQRASAGIVIAPCPVEDRTALLRNADAALYEAKKRGKGQAVTFAPEMRERVSGHFALVQDLRRALPGGELALHYQPLVEIATGRTVGFEALMRWHQPTRGAVPPDVFIPLAEESELIIDLGRFALEEAVGAAGSWQPAADGKPAPYVSVNLSARQFHDPQLVPTIEEVLEAGSLPPHRLVLEVTESAVLADLTGAAAVVKELRRLGIALALDDFGTGHSSLAYVARLEPGIIKIDRSFVYPDAEVRHAQALLAAIVSLGHRLETTVVAEGVETIEQLERLSELGCDVAQGYLFSHPVPLAEVPALLERVPGNPGYPRS